MALGKLQPKNGALAVGGVGGDMSSFRLRARQQVDNTTGYQETIDADHMGSGLREWSLDFSGFAQKDAAGASPGLAAFSDAVAACVCTYDTACTHSFNGVIEYLEISHQKIAGAVPFSGMVWNKGTVTEAWDIS